MAKHNVLNIANNNNVEGFYPLFLGDDLGFGDTVNVTYNELEQHYLDLRSMFWTETEFNMEQDRNDFKVAKPEVGDVMILNLLSQWLMDSLASRSINEVLGPFVTNNELQNMLIEWARSEVVHTRSYSIIIKNCFEDPNAVIERGKGDMEVAYRSRVIGKVFNETAIMGHKWQLGEVEDKHEVRKHILRAVAALYALESVAFMASFSCTFALCETGQFQGIGNHVLKIAEEELEHGATGRDILNILLFKEGGEWVDAFEEVKGDIFEIFSEVVRQEFSWSEYIFQDGRHVLGLNTDMLKDYVRYLAKLMFERTGFNWPEDEFGKAPTKNPLPYMKKYLEPEMVQTANQEIESTNYRIGQVEEDDHNEEFDYDL